MQTKLEELEIRIIELEDIVECYEMKDSRLWRHFSMTKAFRDAFDMPLILRKG